MEAISVDVDALADAFRFYNRVKRVVIVNQTAKCRLSERCSNDFDGEKPECFLPQGNQLTKRLVAATDSGSVARRLAIRSGSGEAHVPGVAHSAVRRRAPTQGSGTRTLLTARPVGIHRRPAQSANERLLRGERRLAWRGAVEQPVLREVPQLDRAVGRTESGELRVAAAQKKAFVHGERLRRSCHSDSPA